MLKISMARWRMISNSQGSTRTHELVRSGRSCAELGLFSSGFIALSITFMGMSLSGDSGSLKSSDREREFVSPGMKATTALAVDLGLGK